MDTLSTMESLNEGQRRAVLHAGTGPLLVIAGAGTGKTKTLAHRVAHLVDRGADIQRVLLLTFSRRAARELERRVGQLLGANGAAAAGGSSPLGWAGTFHAVGARLLRRFAPRIGLAENFTIHDRGDSEDLMSLIRHEHGVADARKERFPGSATCLSIYSHTVNSEAALGAVLRDTFPWCAQHEASLASMFAAYIVAKQAQHVLDFDDLLLYWSGMMAVPELAEEVGAMFDHVFIDEYQDTNSLQGSIVRRLKPDGAGVTVVGDDAQAIYGFRAATVRNILDFPRQYSPPADVVALDRNYRSTGAILRASNAVMALAKEGYTKCLVTDRPQGAPPCLVTVPDEHAQAQCVAEQVLRDLENGIALKSQAVLFRSSHHSAHVELELTRRKIPYVKFGGPTLPRCRACPRRPRRSCAGWRIRTGGWRGFARSGCFPASAPPPRRECSTASKAGPTARARSTTCKVPAPARDGWTALCALLHAANARPLRWPGELESVLDWYRPEVPRLYDDARDRIADLGQLLQIAAAYPTREQFLTDLTLDPPSATQRASRGPVARRGLPDALHHSFGEGPGMEVGAGAELHRRLHSVGHGDGQRRPDRGRAPAALRRDDAGEGSPVAAAAAALLRAPAGEVRRPSRLRASQPFHRRRNGRALHGADMGRWHRGEHVVAAGGHDDDRLEGGAARCVVGRVGAGGKAALNSMLTCIGPPVRTGLRSAKNVFPIGTMPMKSSKILLNCCSVLTASMRCRWVLPVGDSSDSAASSMNSGMPARSRRASISFHAMPGGPGTGGSTRKFDSWSVMATTAQMFSGVTGTSSTTIAAWMSGAQALRAPTLSGSRRAASARASAAVIAGPRGASVVAHPARMMAMASGSSAAKRRGGKCGAE